jgi:hypothetical protein
MSRRIQPADHNRSGRIQTGLGIKRVEASSATFWTTERQIIDWIITHPNEKDVLSLVRITRRDFARKHPISARLYGWTIPKRRGRPTARQKFALPSGSKVRGRPKGRFATACYSALSIGIALALERQLLSKSELVRLLSEERVIAEGWDKSDASPYHKLRRMATVGQETIQLHPELRQHCPQDKERMINLLKQCARENLKA